MFKFKDKKPKTKNEKVVQPNGLTKLTGVFSPTQKIGADEWNKMIDHIEALERRVGELEKVKLI
ncbi:hypothetical protein LCGC14_0677220 [marine sediment metagenome]|uniref:Uncharacterized protein n=1 Tax=marine sediment metagenome TaxID=412755 RepID=A0A0F9TX97_9ZZZZ